METQEIEVLQKALSEHGIAIKTFTEGLMARVLEVEQKISRKAADLGGPTSTPGEMTKHIMASEAFAAFTKGNSPRVEIKVPAAQFKTAIFNATGTAQPLVIPDHRPGVVTAPQRRFTIRDLFPNIPTNSNLVEFAQELVFTNNAGPQGGLTSPTATNGEGEIKPESGITFSLANTPVITLAHFIPASRQILADAPALQNHIENRLLYGLKLEEELELLTGDGTSGKLNGMTLNAATFTGGSTNLSALDAVAAGFAQLVSNEYQPSGVILNPVDWWSSKFMLAKSTQGEYLLGNPGSMVEPRLWGLPVVVTNSMPKGNFMVLDGQRVGYIADREDATIRIAEQHADFFVRNMVAILCEERLAIVIQLGQAMVYGTLSYAG